MKTIDKILNSIPRTYHKSSLVIGRYDVRDCVFRKNTNVSIRKNDSHCKIRFDDSYWNETKHLPRMPAEYKDSGICISARLKRSGIFTFLLVKKWKAI